MTYVKGANGNILMTGATGFLGSNLLQALVDREMFVVILKRSFSDINRIKYLMDKVVFFDLDKTSIEEVFKKTRVNVILHCATDYGRKNNDPLPVIEANLTLPLKLLDAGKKNNISCFINADTFLDKRINYYSLSKQQFKEWLSLYSRHLTCVNMILEHFYGPFDDKTKFVSFVLDKLLSNASYIDLTAGGQKRDFIFIRDVVAAFIKVLENFAVLKRGVHNFEIGTEVQTGIKDFVNLARKLSANNSTKLNFGVLPYRENEVMEARVDTKALRSLGWAPEYSLEEGLRETIAAERNIK